MATAETQMAELYPPTPSIRSEDRKVPQAAHVDDHTREPDSELREASVSSYSNFRHLDVVFKDLNFTVTVPDTKAPVR